MSSRLRWAALGVSLVIAIVATAFVYPRGGSTPVSVDAAVERFRDPGVGVTTVERSTAQPIIGATLTAYSNQPVFGRTRYHEAYEIRLTSLNPRR